MTITKTTEQLNHEIKEAGNIQDFLVSNQNNILTTSLSEHLRTLLFERNLQKKDIQVRLDTTEMRNSLNLKSTATMLAEEASKGAQAVQKAVADFGNFAYQASQIQNGVTIPQLISQKLFEQPDTITTFLPSAGPEISWDPATVDTDYIAASTQTDWEINQNVLDYVPGKFQMIIEQYPQVKIEYLGEPNYVPPSANPNYEEPVA